MKNINFNNLKYFWLSLILLFGVFLSSPATTYSYTTNICPRLGAVDFSSKTIDTSSPQDITVTFGDVLDPGSSIILDKALTTPSIAISGNVAIISASNFTTTFGSESQSVPVIYDSGTTRTTDDCLIGTITIERDKGIKCGDITVRNKTKSQLDTCATPGDEFEITITGVTENGQPYNGIGLIQGAAQTTLETVTINNGSATGTISYNGTNLRPGKENASKLTLRVEGSRLCTTDLAIGVAATVEACENLQSTLDAGGTIPERQFSLCQAANNSTTCTTCLTNGGIWTAIGCLPTDPQELLPLILRIAVGIAGGTSLLIMLYGSLIVTVSAGNPDQLQNGRDIITNAIYGLLMVLFSVVILQIVGVEILQIPGF